jgi:hypothetical protein
VSEQYAGLFEVPKCYCPNHSTGVGLPADFKVTSAPVTWPSMAMSTALAQRHWLILTAPTAPREMHPPDCLAPGLF